MNANEEMCPKCNKNKLSWDQRCKSYLCLSLGCGYSQKEKEDIFSWTFNNGFSINCEDNLVSMYVKDRNDAQDKKDINPLIEKWKYLTPSIIGKTFFDNEDVMVPRELLNLSLYAHHFGVPSGVVLFQMINADVLKIDNLGFVRPNDDLKNR